MLYLRKQLSNNIYHDKIVVTTVNLSRILKIIRTFKKFLPFLVFISLVLMLVFLLLVELNFIGS